MGRIPQETIDTVLAATDIVDLIGASLPLRRAGSSFKALCPFHPEKTPSFHVNPARNTFHCFGCGAGGSAIRFVMDYENVPFQEAVKRLASRAGIELADDVDDPEEEARSKRRRRLVQLHQAITDWFHHLLVHDPAGATAREYLKSRGVSDETATRWKLGYSPDRIADYKAWATEKGFSARELVDSGILALRDDDRSSAGTYPRFRARLMFPVANDYGDTIAFSGRVLDPEAKTAKYINSPETQLFNKGKTLFGLDRAKRPVLKAGHAIICEGQLDLITCAEAGVANIVAPLGTALTEDHARILARYTREIVLCYDADAAGLKAAERAFALLAKQNLDVRVADIPPGEDPDSLVRKQGPEPFAALVRDARPFFDFQIDRGASELDLDSIRDRVAFANTVAENIAHLTDPIATDTAIHQVATRLRLPATELRDLVREKRQQASRRASPRAQRPRDQNPAADAGGGSADAGRTVDVRNRTVRSLLKIALTDTPSHAWMSEPDQRAALESVPESELLLRVLSAQPHPGQQSPSAGILAALPGPEERFLTRLIEEPLPGTGLADAKLFFLDLELAGLKRKLETLQGAISSPSSDPLQEIIQIKSRMLELQRLLATPAPGR